MFRFILLDDLSKVLGIGYDYSILRKKISTAKQTGDKQFSQGLTIEPRNKRVLIWTPKGNVYSIV